jgi:hypothetical protein
MSASGYRWVSLPPDFATTVTDCTIAEAMAFRRLSRWSVYAKIRDGSFRAFKDGRITKIVVASLVADRERQLNAPKTAKRKPGRPRKTQSVNPELRPLAPSPPEAAAASAQPRTRRRRLPGRSTHGRPQEGRFAGRKPP